MAERFPLGSLAEQLAQQLERSRARRTPEENRLVEQSVRELAATGAAERALGVGDRAPGFTLPNQNGEPVSDADLRSLGAYVLSFYRGGW